MKTPMTAADAARHEEWAAHAEWLRLNAQFQRLIRRIVANAERRRAAADAIRSQRAA
jgi:hypothetical protein